MPDATVVNHPNRVRGAFRMARPEHPNFHDGLAALRALAGDPECRAFHRMSAEQRVAEIEAIKVGRAYNPDDGAA